MLGAQPDEIFFLYVFSPHLFPPATCVPIEATVAGKLVPARIGEDLIEVRDGPVAKLSRLWELEEHGGVGALGGDCPNA